MRKTDDNRYNTWKAMKQRCYNSACPDYKNYGGRGITVCDQWRGEGGFSRFCTDMGPRPEGTSIDRIDNDGNYEPGNCRWATALQQQEHKRPHGGYGSSRRYGPDQLTEEQLSKITGVPRNTLKYRLRVKNMTLDEAINAIPYKRAK